MNRTQILHAMKKQPLPRQTVISKITRPGSLFENSPHLPSQSFATSDSATDYRAYKIRFFRQARFSKWTSFEGLCFHLRRLPLPTNDPNQTWLFTTRIEHLQLRYWEVWEYLPVSQNLLRKPVWLGSRFFSFRIRLLLDIAGGIIFGQHTCTQWVPRYRVPFFTVATMEKCPKIRRQKGAREATTCLSCPGRSTGTARRGLAHHFVDPARFKKRVQYSVVI